MGFFTGGIFLSAGVSEVIFISQNFFLRLIFRGRFGFVVGYGDPLFFNPLRGAQNNANKRKQLSFSVIKLRIFCQGVDNEISRPNC